MTIETLAPPPPVVKEDKLSHPGSERSYVGAVLLSNELIEIAMEDDLAMITVSEYREAMGWIIKLYNEGWKDIDKNLLISLSDREDRIKEAFIAMKGMEGLNRLTSNQMSVANFDKNRALLKQYHELRIIRDESRRNADAIEQLAEAPGTTPEDLIKHAEGGIIDITARVRSAGSNIIVVSQDADAFIEKGRRELAEGRTFRGVPTNMPGYDEMMDGFGNGRLHIFGAPTGCHRKGQLILMHNGLLKTVEDIQMGDRVMGQGSRAMTVWALHRGAQEMVRITPNKGESWVVNMDHILTLVETESGAEIDVSVREWLGWSKWRKHIHKLIRSGADFPASEAPLPIEPYFLGLLIGDGDLLNVPTICKSDPEIGEEMERQAAVWGLKLTTSLEGTAKRYKLSSRGMGFEKNPVSEALETLGLQGQKSRQKFIPPAYRVASREQRLQLLAGLVDTDGTLHGQGFEFSSTSLVLAEDVAFVARSLGLAACISEGEAMLNGQSHGSYYRVSIFGDCSVIPTRLPRKKALPRRQKKNALRSGFHVELLPAEDYYGFSVDGNNRYLLGDFTVTHNCAKSMLATNFVRSMAVGNAPGDPTFRVGIIETGELSYEQDWLPRLLASISGVRTKAIQRNWAYANDAESEMVRRAWHWLNRNPPVFVRMADFDGPSSYAMVKRLRKRYGIDVCLFDSIKINAQWGVKDPHNKVGDLSNYLKNAAHDCDIPVTSFIQLTADGTVVGRKKIGMSRPHYSMFAGGQRSSQNADVCGCLDWADHENPADHNRLLFIQKGRDDQVHHKDEHMFCSGDLYRARLTVIENKTQYPVDRAGNPNPTVANRIILPTVQETIEVSRVGSGEVVALPPIGVQGKSLMGFMRGAATA